MGSRSLRLHLLGWLLVPLALFVAFNTWITYRNAVETATVVQDRMLLGSARIMGEQVRYDDGVYQVEVPPAALELFQSTAQDRVYYRIASPRGSLLLGYAELPVPPRPLRAEESIYFDAVMRGEAVRVVVFAQPVFAAAAEGPVSIEVAQTMHVHTAMVTQIWQHAAGQQLLMLALVVVLLWIGLRHGLAPVLRLRHRVQGRKPGALQALDVEPVPNELAPLVHAINDYVGRLDEHMSARSRFIADASHQLRTPLTLLNTQVTYALRSTDQAAKDEALRAMHSSVRQSTRLVNQLLTLSTAEAGIGHPLRQADVDLAEVAQRVLEELAALAQAKNIDLGFELSGDRAKVRATPSLLHELVANLVDNALRYTPAGGVVTVRVISGGSTVMLRVEDSGPGIPTEERERVFERFYRLREDGTGGCGLGLPIVSEIATASEAQVALSEPPSGTGLVVTVTFPEKFPDLPKSADRIPCHPARN